MTLVPGTESERMVKLIFFGSGDFAVPVLQRLAATAWIKLVLVITQADKPAGRYGQLQPTPIKGLAESLQLPVQETLPTAEQMATADLGVVVDYGRIIPPRVFNSWPGGVLNIHPSLLPKYRGPAPIQHALLQGDSVTGISIMRIDRGVDTGPLLTQRTVSIAMADTSVSLEKKLADDGAKVLVEVLSKYVTGQWPIQPQSSVGVSLAPALARSDGQLLSSDTPERIWNKYRAFQPWPGVYFESTGKRIKIVTMVWQDNQPRVQSLQPAGKRPMTVADFKRGYPAISFPHIL